MTDKEEIIIDGKIIGCLCYIDRPLHRYDKGCLVQSQAFKEQQTEEKPILRCDEIKNCPIKENFKQLKRKEHECEKLKKQLMQNDEVNMFFNTPVDGWSNDPCGICPHKAENEELEKTISDFISDNRSMYCYDDRQPVTLDEMQECMEFTYNAGLKYKQTLETIEKELKECVYCESQECACDDFEECLNCVKTQILDIINKAKGEGNAV